jgi:flagellar assembly protein FliH
MIIKKKYTIQNHKKEVEPIIEVQQIPVETVEEKQINEKQVEETKISNVTVEETKEVESIQEELKEEEEEKNNEDLDLSLDNIKFEQRQERREGTRRRGYRRTQDRNVVNRAQQEAISIKDIAKKDGYNEGIQSASKDLQTLKENFSEFFNYKEQVFDKVSECILDIAVEIAKKIINKEIETDKEYIIPVIKAAIEEVNKTENKITLKVMPKDVEIVRDKVADIFSNDYFEAKISVIPDTEIKEGGVIVETSNGIIDASITTQLTIIENALKKQEES